MPRPYSKTDLQTLSREGLGAALPAPRKRSQEESQMQRALIAWWRDNCRAFGVPECLLFSIPNGGGRAGARTGAFLKLEGLRKGAPDLMLAVAKQPELSAAFWRGHHALSLELKRRGGVVSSEQEQFHDALRKQGYKVEVVWSLNDAINVITAYLTK